MSDRDKIKITWDEVDKAKPAPPRPSPRPASGSSRPKVSGSSRPKSYGNVSKSLPAGNSGLSDGGSLFLHAWVYLGFGGLLGALLGWAIFEPSFYDGEMLFEWILRENNIDSFQQLGQLSEKDIEELKKPLGNEVILVAVITLMCLGFAISESVAERSMAKGLTRGGTALALGLVLGYIMDSLAEVLFVELVDAFGAEKMDEPVFWMARGIAWITLGVAAGIIYGVAGQSSQKCIYGCIGGAIGAFGGGFLFDPISIGLDGNAEFSRAFGFGLVGLATGVAMGLVEAALKDRWLFVRGGPLAGKQFVLYKDRTSLGSKPKCDLYLFKDSQVMPEHAVFEIRAGSVYLTPAGPVQVSGQPFSGGILRDGATIQIGCYSFEYREKRKS